MAATSAAARTAGVASTSTAVQACTTRLHLHHGRQSRSLHRLCVAVPTRQASVSSTDKQQAKGELLTWISGTNRGSNVTKQLRGQIEEAQVAVEALSPSELDYSLLEGKWRLLYTTAADVVSRAWGIYSATANAAQHLHVLYDVVTIALSKAHQPHHQHS